MTWEEFKVLAESKGVKDKDKVDFIYFDAESAASLEFIEDKWDGWTIQNEDEYK